MEHFILNTAANSGAGEDEAECWTNVLTPTQQHTLSKFKFDFICNSVSTSLVLGWNYYPEWPWIGETGVWSNSPWPCISQWDVLFTATARLLIIFQLCNYAQFWTSEWVSCGVSLKGCQVSDSSTALFSCSGLWCAKKNQLIHNGPSVSVC